MPEVAEKSIIERLIEKYKIKTKDIYVKCGNCTHTENIHTKHDGRSTKDRECHAFKCRCAKFEVQN